MARERARLAPAPDGEFLDEWFTVETDDGNALSGLDARFDFLTEEDALTAVNSLAVQVNKPLTVVGYTRTELGKYAAVTKIEKVS